MTRAPVSFANVRQSASYDEDLTPFSYINTSLDAGTYGVLIKGKYSRTRGPYIVAGRDTQFYNPESVRPLNPVPIDFGDWEGPVFLFDPADGRATPFAPGPMA